MKEKDYYQILGIDRAADEKKIKSAYRRLAKKYHPDTNAGNQSAEQKFKEVTEAYNVLSDPEKKKLYDRYGCMGLEEGFNADAYEAYRQGGFGGGFGRSGAGRGFSGSGSSGFSGFGQGFGGNGFDGSGFGFDPSGFGGSQSFGGNGNFHEYHFQGSSDDVFGDLFGDLFRRASAAGRDPSGKSAHDTGNGTGYSSEAFRPGNGSEKTKENGADLDLTTGVTVSFEEAASGCDRTIHLKNSRGTVTAIEVHIPAGIDDGKKIRLKGRGRKDSRGAAGDLFLEVHVTPKPGFERKGQDVYVTVRIPFQTAVFGGEAEVPTLTGRVMCKIPAGTQSGSKIRLKGKGIVSMKDASLFGDEYAVIQIDVPKQLSPAAVKALRAYEQAVKSGV